MIIKNGYGEEFTVIPSTYKENENKYKLNNVFAAGMCFCFSEWLKGHNITEDSVYSVYNNVSAIRDGCRLDFISENYCFDYEDGRYQLGYLWAQENGVIYAAVYDADEDRYIGDIVIEA